MITVLGKLRDTKQYAGMDGYNAMLPSPDWTPEKNHLWLNAAIQRGDNFLIVSSHDVSGQFAEEFAQLVRALTPVARDLGTGA